MNRLEHPVLLSAWRNERCADPGPIIGSSAQGRSQRHDTRY